MSARGLTARSRERLDDLAELLAVDRNVPSVLARLGMTASAADILCRRGGRQDLAAIIRVYGGRADRRSGDPYSEGAQGFYIRVDGDPWAGQSSGRYANNSRGRGPDSFTSSTDR